MKKNSQKAATAKVMSQDKNLLTALKNASHV